MIADKKKTRMKDMNVLTDVYIVQTTRMLLLSLRKKIGRDNCMCKDSEGMKISQRNNKIDEQDKKMFFFSVTNIKMEKN